MSWITGEDESNYGRDLIDFSMRAAAQAVAPHIRSLSAQNAELAARLARESRARLDAEVERAVPNYREIDRDPNWHRFLLERDNLSAVPRQHLLNDAIARGDGARVISFFKGFLAQEGAHGDRAPAARAPEGFSKDQTGTHVYTRPEIAKLYESHRRGDFKNREDTWNAIESDIIAATREGRVNAYPYVGK